MPVITTILRTAAAPFIFVWGILVAVVLAIVGAFRACIPGICLPKKALDGSVVVITGGAGGIGKEMTKYLAKKKTIVISLDIDQAKNEASVAELVEFGEVYGYTCDCADPIAAMEISNQIFEKFGMVDILINNAAGVHGKTLLELTIEEIDRTIRNNLMSYFIMTKAFLPKMVSVNRGHIVFVSSVAGIVGSSKVSDYSATKFGIVGLYESLYVELRNIGCNDVKLTLVCPYFIDTGLFEGVKTCFQTFLPILSKKYVAKRIIRAVETNQDILYMPKTVYLLLAMKGFLPFKALTALGYLFGAHTALNKFEKNSCSHDQSRL